MGKIYSVIALPDDRASEALRAYREKLAVQEGVYNNHLQHVPSHINGR